MNQLEYYQNNTKDFSVKKHDKKDLYLIKYKHLGIDWSQPYALEARGIILDGDSNVVARPYKKFFNYKELLNRDDLPREIRLLSKWDRDKKYTVLEKLDGSLAIISQYEDEMIYASSGNMEGKYPHMFKMWFDKNLTPMQKRKLKKITKNHTLLFEYVSPKNRIVVPYKKEDMVLHGIINTKTGEEIFDKIVFDSIAEDIGVNTANRFAITYETIMRVKKQQSGEDLFEGFVVRFDDGKRIKIKLDEYVELHSDHTLSMGKVDSRAKIKHYINRLEEGTLDDLISILEERNDIHAMKVINKVISLNNEFYDLLEHAKGIVNETGFTNKIYAINVGDDKVLDKIVLNIEKEKTLEKIKTKFILDEMEDFSK